MSPTLAKNPLSSPDPWNWVAEEYIDVNVPMLGVFSDVAAARAGLTRDMRVIDVAAGPGTLACKIASQVKQVDAIDFSAEMVAHCQARARTQGLGNVVIQQGDGHALPHPDQTFDRGFSMFGLMFFADRVQGFRELHRVLKTGGQAFVTAWAPVAQSTYMQARIRAMRAADPQAASPATNVLTLEDRDLFLREMRAGGFSEVTVEPILREREFASADELYANLTRGNAPLELQRRTLDQTTWRKRMDAVRDYLANQMGPYPLKLGMTALLGQGTRSA